MEEAAVMMVGLEPAGWAHHFCVCRHMGVAQGMGILMEFAQRLRGRRDIGLPVLATINAGNDLADLIQAERVGRVSTDHSVDTLQRLAEELAPEVAGDTNMSAGCRALSAKLFSPEAVVKQITAALANKVDATMDRHGLRPRDDEATVAINSVASCADAAGARGREG